MTFTPCAEALQLFSATLLLLGVHNHGSVSPKLGPVGEQQQNFHTLIKCLMMWTWRMASSPRQTGGWFLWVCVWFIYFSQNPKTSDIWPRLTSSRVSFGNDLCSYSFIESTWKPLRSSAPWQKRLTPKIWEQPFLLRAFPRGSCSLSPFLGCVGWRTQALCILLSPLGWVLQLCQQRFRLDIRRMCFTQRMAGQ